MSSIFKPRGQQRTVEDDVVNDAGDEDPLSKFISEVTVQLQGAVLGSPPSLATPPVDTPVRRSARSAAKHKDGASIEMIARAAVARRLGSLPPETPFSDRLLQAYLAIFEGPLSDEAVQAIEQLVIAIKSKKKELPGTALGGERQLMPLVV